MRRLLAVTSEAWNNQRPNGHESNSRRLIWQTEARSLKRVTWDDSCTQSENNSITIFETRSYSTERICSENENDMQTTSDNQPIKPSPPSDIADEP